VRIEGLDTPQPGSLLRIIDLAQVKHMPLDDTSARTAAALHDGPVAVLLAVLEPAMTFEMHDGPR
jgi:uncharacterized membrane protein